MTSLEAADVDPAVADAFDRDGVVVLRNLIDPAGVQRMRSAVDWAMTHPSPFVQDFVGRDDKGRFFSDLHNWARNADYEALATKGALPEAAGRLLRARTVRILYDQTLVKEPGTASPTLWHHDLPFWPVRGEKICSLWIALDRVDAESGGVAYLRGSHRSPKRYRPTQPDTPETRRMRNMELEPAPNFGRLGGEDLLTWDLEAGDALAFHALTLHGAGGNKSPDRTRRAVVVRYVGEDVTFVEGPHALGFPEELGLREGDPLSGPRFPVVWSA